MLRVAQSHSRSAARLPASAAAEQSLPGGDTRFDDNHVRLGNVNRSLMALRRYLLLGQPALSFLRHSVEY